MRKSRAVVGFWLMHCLGRPARWSTRRSRDLFARAARGELRVVEGETYPLSEARRAHEDLAGAAHHRQAAARPVALSARPAARSKLASRT